jgi:hypothetical protein
MWRRTVWNMVTYYQNTWHHNQGDSLNILDLYFKETKYVNLNIIFKFICFLICVG